MNDQPDIRRNHLGQLLPGHAMLNPHGRPPIDRPRFNRDAIIDVCVKHNYEPIAKLIELSRQPDASPYLQFAIHKEIVEYLYPKRKSIVIGDENGDGAEIRISWDQPQDGENDQNGQNSGVRPRKKSDPAARRFKHAMEDATATVIDAVLTDDDKDTP